MVRYSTSGRSVYCVSVISLLGIEEPFSLFFKKIIGEKIRGYLKKKKVSECSIMSIG